MSRSSKVGSGMRSQFCVNRLSLLPTLLTSQGIDS
jgi:hypothetical protein